jgi:uncharacterized protein YodC (DUF2158 family)
MAKKDKTAGSDQKFFSGDIVRLKSGGPKMTVNMTFTDGTVEVAFFSEATFSCHRLYPGALKRVKRA